MAISFEELNDSPEESFGEQGMRNTRRFLVDWADRYAFVSELAGQGEIGGTGPIQYPGFPGVRAVGVKIKPFTNLLDATATTPTLTTQVNTYAGKALVTVEYAYVLTEWPGIREITLQDRTYISIRRSHAAEAVVIKSEHLRFDGAAANADDPDTFAVFRVPIIEFQVTWHYVANPPWSAINSHIGKVNSAAITANDGSIAFEKETLLFDSHAANVAFIRLDDGTEPQPMWQLDYVFRYRKVYEKDGTTVGGWNHIYRTKAGEEGFKKVWQGGGTDKPIYQGVANFNDLFQLAAF
jgi:hypothetical protein